MISASPERDAVIPGAAIELHDVAFAYGRGAPILRNCSLDVPRGCVLGVLGPNGSGKTTLLKLLIGALSPSAGSVVVRGRIGYVPQFLQLNFAYTVRDVVVMGRAHQVPMFGTPSRHDEAMASAALERLGMLAFAGRPFEELSGGERQLVVIARALAAEAEILVMDEPMAALDLHHQQTVLQWMRRLTREDGLTVVFTTHQPQHADAIADDVALVGGPRRFMTGDAQAMLQPPLLAELFGVELRRVADSAGGRGTLVPDWRL